MRTTALALLTAFAAASAGHAAAVRVELTIPGSTYLVGQVIPYELKVTNLSSHVVRYQSSGAQRYISPYRITATDSAGKSVRYATRVWPISVLYTTPEIKVCASETFRGAVNEWIILDKPGTYEMTASWHSDNPGTPFFSLNSIGMVPRLQQKSAPLTIRIKAATQQQRDDILSQARATLQAAETMYEKQDAIDLLGYTADDRAIWDIVRAGVESFLTLPAEDALFRFANKDEVREAIIGECGSSGGPYSRLLNQLSRENRITSP